MRTAQLSSNQQPATTSNITSTDNANSSDVKITAELLGARQSFERMVTSSGEELGTDDSLGMLEFALLLLSPQNDAVAPARDPTKEDDLDQPLTHYWIATSHNSYIVGDQLTGLSTADA